ncbi:MAG: hypothetical protein E7345_00950 [Clostridiales bacterium]|nr:hypothetical protein [Clostridiales bacterium]
MPTFSWKKNPLILANNFIKDFKSFESYMKHCVNGMKQINWFKEHQFDNGVSDYEFMEKFLKVEGLDFFAFARMFKYFNEEVLSSYNKDNLITIKTNEYYYDSVSQFIDNFNNANQENLIEGKYNSSLINSLVDNKNYFMQLCHLIQTNKFEIDENRCYTNEEIIELILSGKILIVESFVIPSELQEDEFLKMQNKGEVIFKGRDFNGSSLGIYNCGDVTGYIEAGSNDEKLDWIIKNMLKLHWFRNNVIMADSSKGENMIFPLDVEFDALYEHMNVVLDAVIRNYKKRKKNVPQNYLKLINEVKDNALEQKQIFESCGQVIYDMGNDIIE